MRRLGLGTAAGVLAASAVVALCALGSALVVARALGAYGRGELAAVHAPFLLATTLVAGGLPYAFSSALHARGRSSVVASAGVSIAAYAGVAGALVLLLWGLVTHAPYTWVAVLCVPAATVFAVYLEHERQAGASWAYNLSRIVPAVVTLAVCLTLWALGVRDEGWYLAALIVPSAAMTVLLYSAHIRIFKFGRLSLNVRAPQDVLRQARKAWPSAISDSLLLRLDQVALALFIAPQALGKYAVAVLLAESAGIIRHSLCAARFKSLTVPANGGLARVARTFLLQFNVLALPSYVAIGLFAQFAAVPLLGPSYAGLAAVTWVLLAAQMALDWHLALGTVLLAQQDPGAFSRSSVVALAVHVVALVALAPAFGLVGAGIATLAGYLTAALITGAATQKHLKRSAP